MTHSHKSRLNKPSKTAIALVIFLPIDRKAILEILEDTKPDFKAWTRAAAF